MTLVVDKILFRLQFFSINHNIVLKKEKIN